MAKASRIVFMVELLSKKFFQNLQQRRRGKRLAQKVDRSCRSRAALLVVTCPAADEDDRNVRMACCQLTLDLEPVHVRHANVEHEASDPGGQRRGQELPPRGE